MSTGGAAAVGNSTVIESESVLKTSSSVPFELETTVCALLTAIVLSAAVEKFITSIAPTNENPFTVAEGTAAYPIGLATGNTMLEVGPGRRTLPIPDSVVVSTANTVLVLLSKVARTLRLAISMPLALGTFRR